MTHQNESNHMNEKQINIRESWDINYWSEELNLRAEELVDIVKQVGPSIHEVRLHLAKRFLLNWPASY